MRMIRSVAAALLLTTTAIAYSQRFDVTVPGKTALHGRLILVLSKPDASGQSDREPRYSLSENYESSQGFGVDADGVDPGKPLVVDAKTFGAPLRSLTEVSAGDYSIQAVFNIYEQFHLSSGKTVWLPPDKGEGQKWASKPGNLYSRPVTIHFDPRSTNVWKINADQVNPAIEGTAKDPAVIAAKGPEAKWLKYMKFKSDKLSTFYGRDMFLGAWILLPEGFDEHPDAKYPLVVYQDHFSANFKPAFVATRSDAHTDRGGNGYRFFEDWTSGRLPHVLMIYVQSANPYYDDSYDVDSANVGPYGSAINEELIPAIEKSYRGIGAGWARATFGGSTGGWEAFATQVLYPEQYNGAWAACPDPLDFHGYQNANLYDSPNAFYLQGPFAKVLTAADRKPDGTIVATMQGEYDFETVLGTHGRSTEQWDIWQAVFSPVGPNGYPAEIIDPMTGVVDEKVLQYWHNHYDMAAILKRDWATLGPKLEGKLHVAVGDGDTYFLNNAVHLLENQLKATTKPHSDAEFEYGPGMPHCYTGGPAEYTMQQNNANWAQRVLPLMADHMIKTAPAGADVKSWRY